MSRITRRCTLFCFAALLLWPPLFGQSTPPATQPMTFHISGTITGFGTHELLVVAFEGVSSKTAITNEAGVYEANLPLGLWTMTVRPFVHDSAGKIITNIGSLYRRPSFRVTAPASMVFDISLPQSFMTCPTMVGGPDGGPPTQEQQDHLEAWCAGEEFFSVPADSVPFEVHVWGGSSFAWCEFVPLALGRPDNSVACKRAFATYNTLSVQADEVVYHPDQGILEAHGNVVTQDESGEHKAPSMTFYVHDGQAILMPNQDR
jgi:hypothetical protein